jgi:hypothetical protein
MSRDAHDALASYKEKITFIEIAISEALPWERRHNIEFFL